MLQIKKDMQLFDRRADQKNIKNGIFFSFANVFPPIPSSYKCDKRIFNLKENNVALKYERLKSVPRYIEPIECVIQLGKLLHHISFEIDN